jgi:hypothetical protein
MGPRFRHDFNHVRVHADDEAARSAPAVDAVAYAVGNHISFAAGRYRLDTSAGLRLPAHELAHVVQQAGTALPAPGTVQVGNPADPAARDAERVATSMSPGSIPVRSLVPGQDGRWVMVIGAEFPVRLRRCTRSHSRTLA